MPRFKIYDAQVVCRESYEIEAADEEEAKQKWIDESRVQHEWSEEGWLEVERLDDEEPFPKW